MNVPVAFPGVVATTPPAAPPAGGAMSSDFSAPTNSSYLFYFEDI